MWPLRSVAEVPDPATLLPVVQAPVEPTPSVAFFAVAALLSLAVAAALRRRRGAPGSTSLTCLALGAGWWSLFYALELGSTTLAGTLLFGRLSYLGIVVVPPTWLTFSLAYTGREAALTRGRLALLALPPAATVVLAWTTPSTGLIWAEYELVAVPGVSQAVLSTRYGPAFWAWTAYAYALTAAGTVVLVRSVAKARLFRVQTAALLAAVAAPWAGNAAFLSGLSPLDLTPAGFVVSAVVLGGGFRRLSLLEVTPVAGGIARSELVERLPEAVVAVDDAGRVVDLNPSAESVLDTTLDEAVGAELDTVAPSLADLVASADDDPADYVVSDPRRTYEVRVSPLRSDRVAGRLVTLSDVTERRRREREVAMLNRVLRHDLNNDVAVIENYARLLERDPGNEEYIEGLGRRAAEMRDLVETVRRVERHLDAETPARTRLDLARVVRERTAAVARAHPSATVDTDLPPAAWVTAMDLVGSAVDNVVENAVEHNDAEAPRVRVSVERVDVDGERYVDVVVADDGPRIDPADRAVLVGSEPSLDGATGLGLWLVNWIVTDSGGEVRYEPNEPRGNVVTLRLPAADAEPSSDREGEAEQSRAADSERARSGSSARSGPPDGTPAGD